MGNLVHRVVRMDRVVLLDGTDRGKMPVGDRARSADCFSCRLRSQAGLAGWLQVVTGNQFDD